MRGNSVMKAKRVTGPSAQSIMLTHMKLERCKIAGCKNPVAVTRNPDGVTRVRTCIEHVAQSTQKAEKFDPRTLLRFGWQ